MAYFIMLLPLSFYLLGLMYDRSHRKIYSIITGISVLTPWFALAALLENEFTSFQKYDVINININNIRLLMAISLSHVAVVLLLNKRVKPSAIEHTFDITTFKKYFIYMITLIIIIITYVSYQRAGGFNELILNPRKYEATFGKYRLLNYVYFSSPVLCILLYEMYQRNKNWFNIFLIIVLLVCSTFFGNKTSFIDTFLILAFYIFLTKKSIFSVMLIGSLGLGAIIVYFELVRGGGVHGFVEYIVQGSLNLHHFININSFIYADPLSLIAKFEILHEYLNDTMPLGFILNDKHNTATAFYNLWSAGREPLILLVFFFVYYMCVRYNPNNLPSRFAFACYIPVVFYMFFSYRLFMVKILYLTVLGYISGMLVKKRKRY